MLVLSFVRNIYWQLPAASEKDLAIILATSACLYFAPLVTLFELYLVHSKPPTLDFVDCKYGLLGCNRDYSVLAWSNGGRRRLRKHE
jgi:hypothetical protein